MADPDWLLPLLSLVLLWQDHPVDDYDTGRAIPLNGRLSLHIQAADLRLFPYPS